MNKEPLAYRIRPEKIEEFVGQSHLIGEKKPISSMIKNNTLHSMVFYGPPATGKTTLASIIARYMHLKFIHENAVTLDNTRIKEILQHSLSEDILLFIDEIHRLNKAKQDAFLSPLEKGQLILIGATTENPYFLLRPALRSRVFIYEFKELSPAEKSVILDKALSDKFISSLGIRINEEARKILINNIPDTRSMLNILEMIALTKGISKNIIITPEDIYKLHPEQKLKYNKEEEHYNTISAFIKSIRGSDPDAAIYYLALMLKSGEDPLFIARRLIILASEDIGLAYPEAISIANACYESVEKIGMPEARIILANTTVLFAALPKSNSSFVAIEKAIKDIENGNIMNIPNHLKDSHYFGAKSLGRGLDYKYPHNYDLHYVKQDYTEKKVKYYHPQSLGFEVKLKNWLEKLRDL